MIKDIKLKKTKQGYDWTFNGVDLEIVTGQQQIKSAIIHSILLRKNELITEIYSDKGNEVYKYIPSTNTEHERTLITETLRSNCKEIEGVVDANVEVKKITNSGIIVTNLTVIRENGEEVIINGI